MNFAAHELLETSEALRTKAAEIEQHGVFVNQCNDQTLKNILTKHQHQMMNLYQQGINMMTGKGVEVTHQAPNFNAHQITMGIQNQTTMSAPSANTQSLSDQTIATLALCTHKSGSMMGMQWANECVDPQLRMYHVNCANMCQEMSYEIWTWMNHNGYYQPPTFSQTQVSQMTGMFQPVTNMQPTMMNNYGINNIQ
ncbi:spore coat protein [Anaerobacillus alkaliphilus]|nr:spore coat protein [Anaerobacillus alkaliphilus]